MTAPIPSRILCVDDEPRVLEGLSLTLRRRFDVTVAGSGEAGLAKLREGPAFAAVMSDMRMPVMDGAKFLTEVRAVAPDVTRLLLTGETDIQAAIKAVNEGQIFRFLTKPCPPELLIRSLEGAVEQNRLVTSERQLLEETLRGSIRALCDVLSVANPVAFGRGTRVKRLATKLAQVLGVKEPWAIEVAAMMSQIGYVVLPSATVERALAGKPLSPAERQMVDKVPAIARQVVDNIPRLEAVREILDHSLKAFSGAGATPGDPVRGEKIPLGARILRVAFDYDQLEDSGGARPDILKTLAARTGSYDPRVVAVLDDLLTGIDQEGRRALSLFEIRPGMVVLEDIKTSTGTLLMARGNEITDSSLQRLFNFAASTGIKEPILVAGGDAG